MTDAAKDAGTVDRPVLYSYDQVSRAVNDGASAVSELDLDGRDEDLVNLVVNAAMTTLTEPGLSLNEIIERCYDGTWDWQYDDARTDGWRQLSRAADSAHVWQAKDGTWSWSVGAQRNDDADEELKANGEGLAERDFAEMAAETWAQDHLGSPVADEVRGWIEEG